MRPIHRNRRGVPALGALACAVVLAFTAGCSSSSPHVSAGSTATAATTVATAASTKQANRSTTEAPAAETTAPEEATTTPDDDSTTPQASVPVAPGATTEPAPDTGAPDTEAPDPDATTLPPGAIPGIDDYDGDGQPDPTCGTQDFGAGLVLRIPCRILSAHETPPGTTLVENSLFRLPGEDTAEFEGLSGSLLEARDPDGNKVRIIIFNTDGLFASGSAAINSFETMDAAIRAINIDFPNGAIQIRGHTDSVGSAASNQALSTKRAQTVQAYFLAHGVLASDVTAVGLANTQPLVLETNADGSPNLDGRTFDRRVEIVVRLGK